MAISAALVIIVALAFASKGGGGEKKTSKLNKEFTPIRSMSAFTLKTTSMYSGSYSFSHDKETNRIAVSSFVTYQKGNTTYILPYKYKINAASFSSLPKTNLQFIGVKIKMSK
jgi:hypothetical protein